ncbi:damage-control phosphatase ARMT1 family protein [Actinocrispum sp. NPDC049592]|uniref:damage-control phosphatase ARMT1 family protein n=1 Tax=Actinocrispum sp. NPDC049592 TaxID=3154835 RepID=UPI0034307852
MSSEPPVFTIGAEGSFPWQVFHERHPELVRRLLDTHPYGPAQRSAVTELLESTLNGVVPPPPEHWADRPLWLDWDRGHFATPWSQAPFLWAESYFYRCLLDAVGYFTTGVDLFGPFKTAELQDPALDNDFAWITETTFDTALTAALYGNKADLGFQLIAGRADTTTHPPLLADDSAHLHRFLLDHAPLRVTFVVDNAGRELLSDLILAGHLLDTGMANEVVLHVKPYPYFTSDATFTDVGDCLRRLRKLPGATGDRLHHAAAEGTLSIRTHPFHAAPLSFADMPADLAAEFATGLTIFKGDLNYRRLVGDRDWDPTASFQDAVAYLPAPIAALRTLKSEVVLGLTPTTFQDLEPNWRTSGHHALIQTANLPTRR